VTREKGQWPSPIEPSNLRVHFATIYRLDTNQVEIMLKSSAKSLETTLTELQKAIDGNNGYREIARLGHSLKGVLLNMGELEWAELARRIEKSAGAEEQENYRDIVGGIRSGVEKFLDRSLLQK
jgi:HPt (histidine-containing phosphotransfer) domain-containing protein